MKESDSAPRARRPGQAALDELIERITTDAYGEDEQLWAFRQAFEDEIPVPCEAFVVGEPVSVAEFDYDGNERRGLTAKCRRPDGRKHIVAALDVVFPQGTVGERYVAAYRKWMGIEPFPAAPVTPARSKVSRQSAAPAIDMGGPIELVVLSVKKLAARCRMLGSGQSVNFRAKRPWDLAPGEIVSVKPGKQWGYAGNPYLSGEICSTRIDAAGLGLTPLRLADCGTWDPAEEYWGDEGEPIDSWAKPIIAHGPRRAFEMEQVLPGFDFEDPESDPIGVSNDRKNSGDIEGAYKILMELCHADLRCLDAHAHLGNLAFEHMAKDAIRHYEVGFRIGELSLGDGFNDVLPWGHIDNRPFLRCTHGFGLCLWRLGRFVEASRIFDRMLWLNPSDNQGVRFLIDDIRARRAWEDRRDR